MCQKLYKFFGLTVAAQSNSSKKGCFILTGVNIEYAITDTLCSITSAYHLLTLGLSAYFASNKHFRLLGKECVESPVL